MEINGVSPLAGALELDGMAWAAHEPRRLNVEAGGLRRSLSSTYGRCLGVTVSSPALPFLIFRPLPLLLHGRSMEREQHRKADATPTRQ